MCENTYNMLYVILFPYVIQNLLPFLPISYLNNIPLPTLSLLPSPPSSPPSSPPISLPSLPLLNLPLPSPLLLISSFPPSPYFTIPVFLSSPSSLLPPPCIMLPFSLTSLSLPSFLLLLPPPNFVPFFLSIAQRKKPINPDILFLIQTKLKIKANAFDMI